MTVTRPALAGPRIAAARAAILGQTKPVQQKGDVMSLAQVPRELTIRVTDKHIAEGYPKQAINCPVALAIADTILQKLPGVERITVAVGGELIRVYDPELPESSTVGWECLWSPIPIDVLDRVAHFDQLRIMVPFEFTIKLHEEN